MKTTSGTELITKEELQQAEDLAKRSWKVLLVLLTLALRPRLQVPAKVSPEVEVKPTVPAAVAKALLVDTDPAYSEELASALEIGGFEIIQCANTDEVLQKIEQAGMFILDERLPDVSEACSCIREQSQAPIILIGADSSAQAWQRAVSMGADAYLKRWVSRRELVARIRAIIRRYLKVRHSERGTDNV